LEYGQDTLELHADALSAGARVLLVDDVLATGGTLEAARALVEQLDARIVGAAVLIELAALRGRERWNGTAPLKAALLV
jgi:adenine phosphoribosyltransferase